MLGFRFYFWRYVSYTADFVAQMLLILSTIVLKLSRFAQHQMRKEIHRVQMKVSCNFPQKEK